MASAREKVLAKRSLVSLLQSLRGMVTTVELRNENVVTGKIVHVDGYMNVTMENVDFTLYGYSNTQFDNFFVHGRNIRYVQIPDQVDIRTALLAQLNQEDFDHAGWRDKAEEFARKKLHDTDKEERKTQRLRTLARQRSSQENTDKTDGRTREHVTRQKSSQENT